MTPKREALELLNKTDWMRGLAIVESSSKLKRGTVYVHLMSLEKAGFIRSRYIAGQDPSKPRRREYQITSRGRAALLRDDL